MRSMTFKFSGIVMIAIHFFATCLSAEPVELPQGQEKLTLRIKVIDEDDNPVAGAKITPWALRFGQAHGLWQKDDSTAGFGPESVESDADGMAEVAYPKYRVPTKNTITQSVSLRVDHFDYTFVSSLDITVPQNADDTFKVTLRPGAKLIVRPLIKNKPATPADLKNIHALWSDGRSWSKDSAPQPDDDGNLHFPPMPHGANTVLLLQLEGETVTRISRINDIVLDEDEALEIDIPLERARRIQGMLSEDVPRPIVNGRVKVLNLNPESNNYDRVSWTSWAPVEPDGSFTIDGWPPHEKIQLTALCDGYIAKSGSPPEEAANGNQNGGLKRPQVFPPNSTHIEVEMEQMGRCVITVVDDEEAPIAGAYVYANPNVYWWNGGSQMYCHPLVKSERILEFRDYMGAAEKGPFPSPFRANTNAKGIATMELPVGEDRVSAASGAFEMSATTASRNGEKIKIVAGKETEITFPLRPVRNSILKRWDKLAANVFGCTKDEGRRLLCLPEVRMKKQKFEAVFRDEKNQKDPELLEEWYKLVAGEFEKVEDDENAAKWRKKAEELSATANTSNP